MKGGGARICALWEAYFLSQYRDTPNSTWIFLKHRDSSVGYTHSRKQTSANHCQSRQHGSQLWARGSSRANANPGRGPTGCPGSAPATTTKLHRRPRGWGQGIIRGVIRAAADGGGNVSLGRPDKVGEYCYKAPRVSLTLLSQLFAPTAIELHGTDDRTETAIHLRPLSGCPKQPLS